MHVNELETFMSLLLDPVQQSEEPSGQVEDGYKPLALVSKDALSTWIPTISPTMGDQMKAISIVEYIFV